MKRLQRKPRSREEGGGYSDNGNAFKPDDENETVASRNPLQRNSEFDPVKEDKSNGGSAGADKENGAQVEATYLVWQPSLTIGHYQQYPVNVHNHLLSLDLVGPRIITIH